MSSLFRSTILVSCGDSCSMRFFSTFGASPRTVAVTDNVSLVVFESTKSTVPLGDGNHQTPAAIDEDEFAGSPSFSSKLAFQSDRLSKSEHQSPVCHRLSPESNVYLYFSKTWNQLIAGRFPSNILPRAACRASG